MAKGVVNQSFRVHCRECNRFEEGYSQSQITFERNFLMKNGWKIRDGFWYCPRCAAKEKK